MPGPLRRRLKAWAEGIGEQMHALALRAYNQMIGLELGHLAGVNRHDSPLLADPASLTRCLVRAVCSSKSEHPKCVPKPSRSSGSRPGHHRFSCPFTKTAAQPPASVPLLRQQQPSGADVAARRCVFGVRGWQRHSRQRPHARPTAAGFSAGDTHRPLHLHALPENRCGERAEGAVGRLFQDPPLIGYTSDKCS